MALNRKRIAIIIGGSLLFVAVFPVIIMALVKLVVPAADYFECFIISVDLLHALFALQVGYLVFIICEKVKNGAKS
jgi:hypothetical protein